MSYVHRTVIITDIDDPELHQDIVYFVAEELSPEFQKCMTGPVFLPGNGFVQYVFVSSGLKAGGTHDEIHRSACWKLLAKFRSRAILIEFGDTSLGVKKGE